MVEGSKVDGCKACPGGNRRIEGHSALFLAGFTVFPFLALALSRLSRDLCPLSSGPFHHSSIPKFHYSSLYFLISDLILSPERHDCRRSRGYCGELGRRVTAHAKSHPALIQNRIDKIGIIDKRYLNEKIPSYKALERPWCPGTVKLSMNWLEKYVGILKYPL